MEPVAIDAGPVPLRALLAVSRGAPVRLTDAARARLAASRAVVDDVLAGGLPVYGLTTGVGHLRDSRVPDDQLVAEQYMIVTTHSGGFGPPLPTDVVRAAMAVRLIGLTRGGAGASPAAADALAGLLNEGVHPVIPRTTSVGAGDLSAMAFVAQVAIGAGRAEHRGEVLPGAEALARAGLEPLRLRPKDGLALVSANGISVGSGALVLARAGRLAALADVGVALSMEAARGNPSVVLPVVAAGKPFPGLVGACRGIREALDGSALLEVGVPASVQDPLSFRVAPQVHGAYRDTLAFARQAVEGELNAQADNPLVDVAERRLVSNGNFHPILLAVAFDAFRVAVAHVGQLADRRLGHLWDAFFAAMPPGGPPPGAAPAELPGLHLRYPAAAAAGELRSLAAPVSLDIGALEQEVEDHSTAAPLAVRRAGEALDLLADVLTAELLLAVDILDLQPGAPSLGHGTGAAYRAVRAAAAAATDRSPDAVHRAVREAVDRGAVVPVTAG